MHNLFSVIRLLFSGLPLVDGMLVVVTASLALLIIVGNVQFLFFFIVPYTKILVLPRFVSSMSQEKILTQLPLSRYSTLKIQGGCLIIFFIRNIFIKNFGAEVMTLALIHCRGNICSFIFFPVTKSMFCYILLPFF